MSTILKAPKDAVSVTTSDGTEYTVENGEITVENGEHFPELARHGFTLEGESVQGSMEPTQGEKGQQALPEQTPEQTPEPELPFELPALPEEDPDFDKMNRTQIVEFLSTYGVTDRKASEDKQALVAAAVARLAELRAAVVAPAEGA